MKWTCLILGGGGSIAEFQIGALQIIAERYESFDMYIGIGAGSLNSTVLAQYPTVKEGYKVLLDTWDSFKETSDVFDVPALGVPAAAIATIVSDRKSLYGNKKLGEIIERLISWDKLRGKNNWAIELTSLNDGQLYTVTNNEVLLRSDVNPLRTIQLSLEETDPHYIGKQFTRILTAGGCVPYLLPPVEIFGQQFVEGGIKDCTPLELAAKAFELVIPDGYTEAEFIIVDNYTHDVSFQNTKDMDSGLDILLRTIRIMIVEMAQNDISKGLERLKSNGTNANVILIQPAVEYPLSPMDFSDIALRMKQRNHGVSRAAILIPEALKIIPPGPSLLKLDNIKLNLFEYTLNEFIADPDNTELSDRLVNMVLQSPDHMQSFLKNEEFEKFQDPFLNQGSLNDILPNNYFELKAIMEEAFRKNQKIKAVGAGFAFDDITGTQGVSVRLSNLDGIWETDSHLLKDPLLSSSLVEFESGTTIDELNKYLWDRGRALLNQPGYEGLSFSGVSGTGGHGSGIRIGPIAEAIASIDLLSFNAEGKLVHKRIEQTNGITDRSKFEQKYPKWELIQDDDHFNACRVSMGCMGIIYSYIIKTQKSYFLEETRIMQKWEQLKLLLPAKLGDSSIHSIHIWFNPYYLNGEINCVLSEYRIKPGPRKGKRGYGVTFGLVPELAPFLLWIMQNFPRNLPATMNSTLKATVNKNPVTMPAPEALNFGTPNLVNVDATNCGIPADRTIEVAERLFRFARERFEQEAYITSPIGFRFTSQIDAFMAPQYKRLSCMIELPLIKPTPHAMDTITGFLNTLILDHEGRPHWGQRFNDTINPVTLRRMYPELDRFKDLLRQYNPFGTFYNHFTARTGLE